MLKMLYHKHKCKDRFEDSKRDTPMKDTNQVHLDSFSCDEVVHHKFVFIEQNIDHQYNRYATASIRKYYQNTPISGKININWFIMTISPLIEPAHPIVHHQEQIHQILLP